MLHASLHRLQNCMAHQAGGMPTYWSAILENISYDCTLEGSTQVREGWDD
jgi:hypothetical protein